MILYHGSGEEVQHPKIIASNRGLDFGVGFYTTIYKQQAIEWAKRKCNILKRQGLYRLPVVSVYNIDRDVLKNIFKIKEFRGASEAWLEFVISNRKSLNMIHFYDIVIGEVADDKVFNLIDAYEAGFMRKEDVLKRIKYKEKNNQVSFHTEQVLKYLKFKEAFYC